MKKSAQEGGVDALGASSRDAQAGWVLFRESNYTMELDEINARLNQRGFNPIALRTYNHYRKLERYGYQRYVPINQLDVETLRDPVWVGPLRSRYRLRTMKFPAQLVIAIDEQVVVLQGETTQASPVEVVLHFRDEKAREILLGHNLEGHQVFVLLHPETETRSAMIELVEDSADRSSVTATLAFLTLDTTHEFPGARVLDRTQVRAIFTAYDSSSPLNILRELYGFFEALDATRLICDEVLAASDAGDQYQLPPSRVTSLKMQSPLEIAMSIASAPLLVLMALASRFEHIRQLHHTATLSKANAEFRTEEVRTLRVQNNRLELHAYMEHVAMVPYIAEVLQKTGAQGNQRIELQMPPETLIRINQLTTQVYSSVDRLFNDNIKAIKFETQLSGIPLRDRESPDQDNQGAA